MNRKAVFFIFISVLAGLNLGTILKSEDPIRDTQTNPILYEQKKEEEKDGKKGPLLYNVKNSPRETFFIDPPFEKEKKSSSRKAEAGEATSPSATADWWEEQPAGSQAISPGEKAPDPKAQEPSAAAPEAEDGKSGKGDNYWW